VDATLNPSELRVDRKRRLQLEARYYASTPSSAEALWLRGHYQHRVAIGWNELWLNVSGTWLLGNILFPDEEPLGNALYGCFGTSVFARAVANAGAEYRHSLVRDAVKVGVFYDQAVYGALDRSGGPTMPSTAGAGGPSVHILLADEFELAGYLAFGWRAHAIFDFAPTLTLRQVF